MENCGKMFMDLSHSEWKKLSPQSIKNPEMINQQMISNKIISRLDPDANGKKKKTLKRGNEISSSCSFLESERERRKIK